MSSSTPPYTLFVTSHPACTRSIYLAGLYGPAVIQLVNAKAVNPRPEWLVGVPLLITNHKPGPPLTGTFVNNWLESGLQPQQQGGLVGRPQQQLHQQQQQQPQQGGNPQNRSALDALFVAEFDKQGKYVANGTGYSGQVSLQEGAIGNQYVGAGRSYDDDDRYMRSEKVSDADIQRMESLRNNRVSGNMIPQTFIGTSDLEPGVKLTM